MGQMKKQFENHGKNQLRQSLALAQTPAGEKRASMPRAGVGTQNELDLGGVQERRLQSGYKQVGRAKTHTKKRLGATASLDL